MTKKWKRIGLSSLRYVVVSIGAVIMLIPLVWLVSTSLKPAIDIFLEPPKWIPNPVDWTNYVQAVTMIDYFLFFRNSLVITLISIGGYSLSTSLAAYGFARLRFPGRTVLFMLVLSTLMLPFVTKMIPQYIFFVRLKWINTFLPLTVPAFFACGGWAAYFIFLQRQFFLTIPFELEDAAKIDGCGTFGMYSRIILPLSKPILILVIIFAFGWSWNDFLTPLIYLQSKALFTVSLGLQMFRGEWNTPWNILMAAAVISLIPIVVLFCLAQRYFIQGVRITGVKG